MSGVDVLTEIERVARAMDSLCLLDHAKRLRDCESAVAELIEAGVDFAVNDSLDAQRRFKTALARVQGGAE